MHTTPANDEPGSPAPTPAQRRARLKRLVDGLDHGAAARAGIGAILREIEGLAPGAIDREAARIQGRRLGLPPVSPLDLSFLNYPEA